MKTFVLFWLLFLGHFNFLNFTRDPNDHQENLNACNESLEFNQPISNFQLFGGSTSENTFKKVIFHQNNYYVIGSNVKKASLHKFDLTGNLIWSSEVNDTSSWNDLIVTTANRLLLVGSRDVNAGLAKDVLIGVYDLNGTAIRLDAYDYGINESYNSIVENPLPGTAATRYVVLGSINLTTNKNDDDVILTAMNESGGASWRRKYGALNQDDEFHTKLSVYNAVSGQLAMSGHLANFGCYVVVNLSTNGAVTNLGRSFGANSRINDFQRTPNGEFLLASSVVTSPPQAQIIKVSVSSPNNFIYRNLNYNGIHQIVSINPNTFYALGTGSFSGVVRPMIFQFSDLGSSLGLNLIRYINNGETSFSQGLLTQIGTNDLAYADGRVNPGLGIGAADGFLAIHAGSLDECGLSQLDNSFSKLSFTPVTVQPSSILQSLKEPFILTASSINYSTKRQCQNNCIVEFTSSELDSCGNFQFNATSNLSGTLNFCWNFGDAPPCGSTIQNPAHQYVSAGNYTVCVTVTNGINTCQSCHSVHVSFADKIPPSIVCPPRITVDCSQPTSPPTTGYPIVSDNFDPIPVVSYNDFIIQMTPCYKEILRDWSARDFCGNIIHCQQKIIQKDTIAPTIVCPSDITIACNIPITPDQTGIPTITDNCQHVLIPNYRDSILKDQCPLHILREWLITDSCGNSSNCFQNIYQVDSIAPKLICPQDVVLNCGTPTEPEFTGFPYILEACSGILISFYEDSVVTDTCPSIIYRKWTAVDSCGNSSICIQEISIDDVLAPVFQNCNRKIVVQGLGNPASGCEVFVEFAFPDIEDDCDPSPVLINNYTNTSNASAIYPEGTTLVIWTATDACGNIATCVDTICVLPCGCPDTCTTNTLLISTGYDPISGVLLPPGSATSQWTLVESPLWGGSGSAPAYVISPISGWASTAGAANWISAHPFADWIQNNPAPDIPYTFQNCFCVCEDSSLVGIKMRAYADDAVEICLTDASGNFISNLLSITSSSSTDHTPFDGTVDHSSSNFFTLNAGEYCIRAKLRNLHGVAMGLNIQGLVYGAGLLESVCCNQNNFVTGYKFLDKKCDGERSSGDMPGTGWTIQLKDGLGNIIDNAITLGDGFYSFQNVPIGHYTVCEVQQSGYLQSFPPTGTYEIDVLDSHSVISGLNFGNCPLDTCCINEEAFLAVAATPVDVIRDSCMVCIFHPCIGWCQRMTIDWGDGTTSGYFEGIGSVDASHTYSQSGQYTICLKYEEIGDNGEVCFQKDSCFSVCVECSACVDEVLVMDWFKLFGDSNNPTGDASTTIPNVFANVSDFYIDSDGSKFYATGHYHGSNSQIAGSAINTDGFILNYSNTGILNWSGSISGNDIDQGLVIKHIPGGGFYIGGIFNSPILTLPFAAGSPYEVLTNANQGSQVFLAKYNESAIPPYAPIISWALTFGNDQYRTLLSDFDLDINNNPVLVGIFTGEVNFNPLFTPTNASSGGQQDYYMASYDSSSGSLRWVKSLVQSTSNTGGIYPHSVSCFGTDEIYICGEYSQSVDFDNDNTSDLIGGPINNPAPFFAKFYDIGTDVILNDALPIKSNNSNPARFEGLARDIEAYAGGFAVTIQSYPGSPYMINLDPVGNNSTFNIPGSGGSSFIIRYDNSKVATCYKEIPGSPQKFSVNEMSVDGNGNIYFAAGERYNEYNLNNIFFGVLDNACNIKSLNIDASGYDEIWSIIPDADMGIAIIGRSSSLNLKPNPSDPLDIFTSTGDPDILIGKYSCQCIRTADTINCCDNIYITTEKYYGPNPLCTDSACCYSVDLNNNAGFSIKKAEVNILTSGWTFGSTNVASGLNITGSSVAQLIENPAGNLPGGLTQDFFKFCLVGQIGAASTQEIEFVWYEKTKSGACIAVCRDTLLTNCIAPTCAINCTEVVNMQIVCDSLNPNQYCLRFNVINLSPFAATGVSIGVVGTDFGLVPCGSTGFFDPLDIDFGTPLDPGNTSALICIKLISTMPISSPQDVCFEFGLTYSDTSFCFQDTQFCYLIAPCCNPCEEIQITARTIEVDSASCCYAIDLNIGCGVDYFGKIEIESLSSGVSFSTIDKNPSWIYCTPPTPDLICLDYPGSYLPNGITTELFKFCIDSSAIVEDLSCWKQISMGGGHALGIKENGSLYSWGWNSHGQLGNGSFSNSNSPVQIDFANDWKLVAAGYDFSFAIKNDGSLWAWGSNNYGQLGNGTIILSNVPIQIGSSYNWKTVSAGFGHTLALQNDGSFWSWGFNGFGQLGDGSNINKIYPNQVGVSLDWSSISAGGTHSVVLKNDGTLWTCGINGNGQLGDGTYVAKNIPIQIGTNWKEIEAGHVHTLAIKNDGSLWSWGFNSYGQLGDGTVISKNIPVQIGSSTDWSIIAAGGSHSLSQKTDGSIWGWGLNSGGQLGDGTNVDKNQPIILSALSNAEQLQCGDGSSLALQADDGHWAWGGNFIGQLGDGSYIDNNSPLFIPCQDVTTLAGRTQVNLINALSLSSMFKIRYYESDDLTVACDTMLTLECLDDLVSCLCDYLGNIEIYNSEFSLPIKCQANNPVTYLIECPKNETSFNIEGSLFCTDSCDGILQWEIKNDLGNTVFFGTEFVDPTYPLWTINFLYSQFTQGENYTIHLNGICGQDTCVCDFKFKMQECDTCCQPKAEFINIVENAIHINVDQNYCKATLTFDDLPCNMSIQTINWKDGTISTGPFYPGSMVMHTYTPTQMSFLIAVTVVEYDENGKICNNISLLLTVNLNCLNCCKKGISAYFQWQNLISQGIAIKVSGCSVKTATPQFGDCYFYEASPEWGDGSSVLTGPFQASSVWTHTYAISGTYTICVTVSEYPNGDPTKVPCRSYRICETINVTCIDSCICEGFSDLSFYYDKQHKVMAACGDTLKLDCPPDDCAWTFSGNLLCKNDCPESLLDWKLVETNSGNIVASGTSVAFPGFGIYIPPAIVSSGGEFDLILTGQCAPNVTCPCTIHLIFPGCNEICPCDPDDLVEDVEKGISKITILNNCTACFSPLALSECDMVSWYSLPNLTTPIAISVGNQLICQNFKFPGNYLIKMLVTRKKNDGTICAVYEKIFSISVNCFTEPTFGNQEETCLLEPSISTNLVKPTIASNWKPIHGNPAWNVSNDGNSGSFISLKGQLGNSDAIISSESVCLKKFEHTLRMRFAIPSKDKIKHGSRLMVCVKLKQVDDIQFSNLDWTDGLIKVGQIDLSVLPEGDMEYQLTFNPQNWLIQRYCIDGDGFDVHFVVYLENDLEDAVINANSELNFQSLCISQSKINTTSQSVNLARFEVHPNPTNNSFHLNILNANGEIAQVEVFDQFGRIVENFNMDGQHKAISFGELYPSALYFLRVSIQDQTECIKLVKVSK